MQAAHYQHQGQRKRQTLEPTFGSDEGFVKQKEYTMGRIRGLPTRVSNISKVNAILSEYVLDFAVDLTPDEDATKGTISIRDGAGRPAAIHRSCLPDPQDCSPAEYKREEEEQLTEQGEAEFGKLLLKLAPFFKTTLVVLSLNPGRRSSANVWIVNPKAKEVVTLEVSR